jgi:uncharacterized membrane protein
MQAALYGLATALCFGVGGFAAQRLTARSGWLRAALAVQGFGLLAMLAGMFALDGAPRSWGETTLLVLGLGGLNVVSLGALYRALAIGELSVVGPIASSHAAVTVGLAAAFGAAPPQVTAPGLVLVITGVALLSSQRRRAGGRRAGRGVGWALLSSATLGAVFFWLPPATRALGLLWPLVGMRAVAVAALGLVRGLGTARVRDVRPPALLVAACVLLDAAGLLLYARGAAHGDVAVVAVLASLSAAVTLALAQWRLRERLATHQWFGVVMVIAGTTWLTWRAA